MNEVLVSEKIIISQARRREVVFKMISLNTN